MREGILMGRMANDLSRFAGDISEFRSTYQKLTQDMQDIKDTMAALNSSWTGEAHDQLEESFEADCRNMQEVIDAIGKVLENLDYADQEYNSCETTVSNIISDISV